MCELSIFDVVFSLVNKNYPITKLDSSIKEATQHEISHNFICSLENGEHFSLLDMSFENIVVGETKYFNFKPPIPYRLIKNGQEDVRLKLITCNFVAHEKQFFNEKAQFPYLVKIKIEERTELEALKQAVENAIGEPVDASCDDILYVNTDKENFDMLKLVPAGAVMAFEIKVRHLVHFSAMPRLKYVLDLFYSVPVVQPLAKKPKLKRQNAIGPHQGAVDDFLSSFQE